MRLPMILRTKSLNYHRVCVRELHLAQLPQNKLLVNWQAWSAIELALHSHLSTTVTWGTKTTLITLEANDESRMNLMMTLWMKSSKSSADILGNRKKFKDACTNFCVDYVFLVLSAWLLILIWIFKVWRKIVSFDVKLMAENCRYLIFSCNTDV